jgi:CRP-like cAMP-binding protein
MAIDPILQTLRKIELFRGLRPLQVSEIARRAERIVFKTGATMIESGQAGDAAILLVAGAALRTKSPDGSSVSEAIPPGTLLGEMAMLVETDYSSTVVAHGTVKALRITRRDIYEQMERDPELADHLVATLSRRLTAVAAELRALDEKLFVPDFGSESEADFDRKQLMGDAQQRSDSSAAN